MLPGLESGAATPRYQAGEGDWEGPGGGGGGGAGAGQQPGEVQRSRSRVRRPGAGPLTPTLLGLVRGMLTASAVPPGSTGDRRTQPPLHGRATQTQSWSLAGAPPPTQASSAVFRVHN